MAKNVDPVNEAYATFTKGDIPALLESLSDDVDWSSPATLPHGGDFGGKITRFREYVDLDGPLGG
jgi:ketosteroid isomerase-like protein